MHRISPRVIPILRGMPLADQTCVISQKVTQILHTCEYDQFGRCVMALLSMVCDTMYNRATYCSNVQLTDIQGKNQLNQLMSETYHPDPMHPISCSVSVPLITISRLLHLLSSTCYNSYLIFVNKATIPIKWFHDQNAIRKSKNKRKHSLYRDQYHEQDIQLQ